MASAAQSDANRRNAQRSTGPNTAEGKAASSRNAVRHGILAAAIPAETDGFHETLLGLYQSLRPMDEAQRFLVDQIAVSMVRLQRAIGAEQRFLDTAASRATGDSNPAAAIETYLVTDSAALSLRYEAALVRQIQRSLRLFREMKSDWDWKLARKGLCPYLDGDQTDSADTTYDGIP